MPQVCCNFSKRRRLPGFKKMRGGGVWPCFQYCQSENPRRAVCLCACSFDALVNRVHRQRRRAVHRRGTSERKCGWPMDHSRFAEIRSEVTPTRLNLSYNEVMTTMITPPKRCRCNAYKCLPGELRSPSRGGFQGSPRGIPGLYTVNVILKICTKSTILWCARVTSSDL